MALPEEKTELQGQFLSWLAQPEIGAFEYKKGCYFFTVIRARKNADFDFNYLAIYSLDEDDFPYTVKGKMTTATKKSQAFTVVEDFEPSNLDD